MNTCPTCGTNVSGYAARVIPLESRNGIVIDGRHIKMEPSQFDVFDTLFRAYPASASYERLIDDLWGAFPSATAREAIPIYVCRLRRLFRNSALSIVNNYCLGFRLQIAPRPGHTAIQQLTQPAGPKREISR